MTINEKIVKKLFTDSIEGDNKTHIAGRRHTYDLSIDVLEAHRDEIVGLLTSLPDNFKKSLGGGWSILMACEDREGNVWTNSLDSCEQLLILGMGIGLVKYAMPRQLWDKLPGGAPYYVVDV